MASCCREPMNNSKQNDDSPNGRGIVVGVSGGIACYKSAALVSKLVQSGSDVSVVMTDAASHFIGEATFAALTGKPVGRTVFSSTWPLGAHVELSDSADLLCIAPASADVLGKLANGIADDLLTTLYLYFAGKVIVAPAMNNQMWSKPSVQRNVAQLEADGVEIVGPEEGWLSCRKRGKGRMAEPETIIDAISNAL